MIFEIIKNKIKYLNNFNNSKIFLEIFGTNKPYRLNLFYKTWQRVSSLKLIQHCGVMKPFGRHALLSRGWGSQDKRKVEPIPTLVGTDRD